MPLFLVLSLCTAVHAQSSGTTSDGLVWSSSGGVVTITGYTGSSNAVNIPATIFGLPVTSIGIHAFGSNLTITSVTFAIPSSVTSIENYAFLNCASLSSVTLPGSVTSIGDQAFGSCTNLTSIQIPNAVSSIGNLAFFFSGLQSVTVPSSVTSIGNGAFTYCTNLNAITVDPQNAAYSSGLDGVLFDKNQTTLIQCPGAKAGNYMVPNSVATIGSSAFNGCNSLTTVEIPASVTSIAGNPFYSTTALISITVDPSNPNYSNNSDGVLFNKNKTTLIACGGGKSGSYTVPSGVNSIGNSAFGWCVNLTNVTLPNGVTSIGRSAFDSCSGLISIQIPNDVATIETDTFYFCTSLKSVNIPGSVTSIGAQAFTNCQSLTSVTLSNGLTSIGTGSFEFCTSLASMIFPSTITVIGDQAFVGCSGLKSAIFMGGAPSMGSSVFLIFPANGFAVYYFHGAPGFNSPWTDSSGDTYQAVDMGPSSAVAPWLVSNGYAFNTNLASSPNGDGVSLLLDYALNLDPTKNQSKSLPKPQVIGNQLSINYYSQSAGVAYTVQTSADLINWNTTGVQISGPDANGMSTATVTNPGQKRFMRLLTVY